MPDLGRGLLFPDLYASTPEGDDGRPVACVVRPAIPLCACGHPSGDHQHSGSKSLSLAAVACQWGRCTRDGCDCTRFDEQPGSAPAERKQGPQGGDTP